LIGSALSTRGCQVMIRKVITSSCLWEGASPRYFGVFNNNLHFIIARILYHCEGSFLHVIHFRGVVTNDNFHSSVFFLATRNCEMSYLFTISCVKFQWWTCYKLKMKLFFVYLWYQAKSLNRTYRHGWKKVKNSNWEKYN
jgi:hypothetical protein